MTGPVGVLGPDGTRPSGRLDELVAVDGRRCLSDPEGRPLDDKLNRARAGQWPGPVLLGVLAVGAASAVRLKAVDCFCGVRPASAPVVEVGGSAAIGPCQAEPKEFVGDGLAGFTHVVPHHRMAQARVATALHRTVQVAGHDELKAVGICRDAAHHDSRLRGPGHDEFDRHHPRNPGSGSMIPAAVVCLPFVELVIVRLRLGYVKEAHALHHVSGPSRAAPFSDGRARAGFLTEKCRYGLVGG